MPKERKRRKDTPKMRPFEKRPWLGCRSCGEKWYPDARKWRNKNPAGSKYLRCPHCNVRNRVPRVIVKYLIEKANRETTFGFD